MEFWYLYHSGFAVKTEGHFLIFDCYYDVPVGGKLDDGVIDPGEIASFGLQTVIFASHRHGDHYKRRIFEWRETLPGVTYLLSDDIRTKNQSLFIGPNQERSVGELTVRTLESTDLGVAFLVKVDGHTLYHAGDLNWWDWQGESDDFRQDMGQRYRAQIDLLQGESIDLAFLPVDPRLEDSYLKGLEYFMEKVGAKTAVPMHFGQDLDVCERMMADTRTQPYREHLLPIHRRGEHFEVCGE